MASKQSPRPDEPATLGLAVENVWLIMSVVCRGRQISDIAWFMYVMCGLLFFIGAGSLRPLSSLATSKEERAGCGLVAIANIENACIYVLSFNCYPPTPAYATFPDWSGYCS